MTKWLCFLGSIVFGNSPFIPLYEIINNIFPFFEVEQSAPNESDELYERYNLLKPDFEIDLTQIEGFLSYLL